MKTKFITTVLALIFSSCVCVFAKDKITFEKKQSGTTKTEQQKDSAYYTCPMHPEVKSPNPGTCFKCGMKLIKKSFADEKKGKKHKMDMGCGKMQGKCDMDKMNNMDKCNPGRSQQSKSVSDSTKVSTIKYYCSMHPEVISDAPGKCPKCGMELSERKRK